MQSPAGSASLSPGFETPGYKAIKRLSTSAIGVQSFNRRCDTGKKYWRIAAGWHA